MKYSYNLREKLIDYLVQFKFRIQSSNRIGLYDVNTLSQEFIAKILNLVDGNEETGYQDLDKIKANYPAVDVGSFKQKIAYQITSQNNTQKIYSTIEKFVDKYGKTKEFEKLRFIILNDINWTDKQYDNIKDKYHSAGLVYEDISILSIDQLEALIGKLENDRIENLIKIFQKEFGEIQEIKNKNEGEEDGKITKELHSKLYHIRAAPWSYGESEEEYNFKQELRGKDDTSCQYLAIGKHTELIDLWKPLEKYSLFDINHPHWLDKPFFRRYIQAAKQDVCLSTIARCTASKEKGDVQPAIEILREVLMAPTYSTTGGSSTQLPKKKCHS